MQPTFHFEDAKTTSVTPTRGSVADLYAGVGGIGLGFSKFGFSTQLALDFDPYCKPVYDLNHGGHELIIADIGTYPIDQFPDVDVLLAGFPCQPFSVAGYRKGFEDENRGNQFFNIYNILRAVTVEALLLENVKNLANHDNGKTLRIILEALDSLGYHVKHQVLNTMHYSHLPQTRERIFIAGFKSRSAFERFQFPEKNIEPCRDFRDFLESNVDEKYYYTSKHTIYPVLEKEIVKTNTIYQFRRHYVRENKKSVCPTLTANMGMGGHNVPIILDRKGIRKLTPRECFNLQGFDSAAFRLPENVADSRLYKLAGNSVSVSVIEKIAERFAGALYG